ncbi:MAG: hypothetical protein ACI9OJ_003350 [Myxococcota bacterium]
MSLEAVLGDAINRGKSANGTLTIGSGPDAQTLTFDATNFDVVRTIDLPSAAGTRQVELSLKGQGGLGYQLGSKRFVDSAQREVRGAAPTPLTATVTADKTKAAVGDDIEMTVAITSGAEEVRMPTVSIGIPAGFDADKTAIVHPAIKRTEILGRRLVIYLTELAAETTIQTTFRLTARRAGTLQPGLVRAWPYYEPDRSAWVEQSAFVVSAK